MTGGARQPDGSSPKPVPEIAISQDTFADYHSIAQARLTTPRAALVRTLNGAHEILLLQSIALI
jgi:hypothetical protein